MYILKNINYIFWFDAFDGKEHKSRKESTKTYAIKTNFNLFKEYLKNADNIELSIKLEKSQHIIGTAYVKKLINLFFCKSFTQSSPIFNNNGVKIGDVYVRITLTPIKNMKSLHSMKESKKKISTIDKSTSNISSMPITNMQNIDSNYMKYDVNSFNEFDNLPLKLKNIHDNDNIYQSILKDKRSDFTTLSPKSAIDITDKLVAQVVARARKLRSEMTYDLKTQAINNEDSLLMDGNSISDSLNSNESVKKEAALYEYFLGKEMSFRSEKNALETLRTCSPTPSLIDIATETIKSCNQNKLEITKKERKTYHNSNFHSSYSEDDTESDSIISSNKICLHSKAASPLDYVDSVKIIVDFLILSSAGYRRVKSSCISRGDGLPIAVTYIVQYDTMFINVKNLNKNNKKILNPRKSVKMCSKRQEGLLVYFNHENVYDLSKQYLYTDVPLKFKVFNRHINQKTPTELGLGSIYISDASKSQFLSSTQKVAIIKKGIKTGELKVKIELGCDKIHFGRQFVEAISSAKENIPVLELSSDSMISKDNSSHKYRTITGNESKSGSKGNVSPAKQDKMKPLSDSTKKNKKNTQHQKRDEVFFDTQFPNNSKEKILLHGLIYVGDGKDLPEMSTYLICRAFWREDRSISRVCSGTTNPFYHFHQLVPLIHGPELLERTKDNCIIIEVYSRHAECDDKLIGIAKLSVHQLYVAFRDPLVLPHLLKSKYPIISVDGWVPITDPVSGKIQGQLYALVALGTVDQIALLEMTRGLRDPYITAQINRSDTPKFSSNIENNEILQNEKLDKHYSERFYQNNHRDRLQEKKSQECQTEITTVNDLKRQASEEFESNHEKSTGLHEIIDRSAHTSTVPRTIVDQEAQVDFDFSSDPRDHIKVYSVEPLCLDGLNSNSYSIESSNGSPRDNFNMPREIFRSVGVGAEFDEEVDLTSNNVAYDAQNDGNVAGSSFHVDDNSRSFNDEEREDFYSTERHLPSVENQSTNISNDVMEKGFNAAIEISWALHLPKIEKDNQFIDPCTYVTFQKFRDNTNTKIDAYMTTDVYPFSCNPKYDWRINTKLSCDLLTKQDKKLIMKVWRLIDPDVSMEVNIEKDIGIGSAVLDLTVLTVGFPLVSGWFNITDFNGKCNGQLQVSVTPLDNIDKFKTSAAIAFEPTIINEPHNIRETNESKAQARVEPVIDIGFSLEDTSMSFLSQSLKQKLSELDEIKQRLQSRLQDVTNTAFDDYENDFDFGDHDDDHEGTEKNDNQAVSNRDSITWSSPLVDNQSINCKTNTDQTTSGNRYANNGNDGHNYSVQSSSENNTVTVEGNPPDTGYSSNSNNHGSQNLTNGNIYKDNSNYYCKNLKSTQTHYRNQQMDGGVKNHGNEETSVCNFNSNSSYLSSENQFNEADYPIRGTRIHINHLLDKLSTQLSSAPPPINYLPMKRNIMDLISSLRRNNNNISHNVKCNREAHVRTVPTQTDMNYLSDSKLNDTSNNTAYHERDNRKDDTEIPAKTQKREKISTVIRDELIADDHNDTTEYDYLSTYLMTSNVRHMGVNGMNPLFYTHMIPDLPVPENDSVKHDQNVQQNSSPSSALENEAAEILDNRYVESFNATIKKGIARLKNIQHKMESTPKVIPPNSQELAEHAEEFRVTPSVVSENIDVTVMHKPCNDDLMASNSMGSTTTTSIDNNTQTFSEIDDNSSLNSSDTSVLVVSRQAPDGGNPIEDVNGSSLSKPNDHSTDSSSTKS
ncbi:uncharacterized protein [Chelonus insularis]|uniref:uncharacterized protein isoform X2 n=1 Tax=Chelonus insularis TaxID=460826 RepID=UPI00158B2CDC|nr:uncharacterized protein LOC118064482 isoform X2 [Chelonus insularis]